ncbi:MAG: ATP-binding protein [Epsilonproteobacteria bacterium]|nr:ATP-binding protein [Campylobacterota bacterium]
MDILEILYSREFKKVAYHVRKVSLEAKKTILLGPKGSGKSSMIFDYLSMRTKGSFLYLDFDDFRLTKLEVEKNLVSFINKYNISLLVLENFNFDFEVPECDEVIITTNRQQSLEGFTTQILYPLDFEEFIAFETRQLNLETTFSHYIVQGTFPALQRISKSEFVKEYQSFLYRYADSTLEMAMLQLLSKHQGSIVSMHALFQILRENYKISKDTFYAYTNKLQQEYIFFLVEKFGSSRSAKKLYMIDFALRSALSFEKDFIKRFENIIFLELLKRDKKVFYTDTIDFYLPEEHRAILTMPFLPENLIVAKLERLHHYFVESELKVVQVVTMEVEKGFEQNGIMYECIPFWSFATSL